MTKSFDPQLVGIALVLAALGCSGKVQDRPADLPVAVRTLVVRTEPVELAFTATGTLEPEAKVTVAAQEEELVTAVHVREGDRVKRGELLVELDDRQIRASLAEEEARRTEAEAQWHRTQALASDGLISPAQADTARAAFQTASARADALRTRLSFTRITAPVDGTVTSRKVEVGNLAAARAPLVELASGAGLILRVPVSELEVVKLATGNVVSVTVDALPDVKLTAHIARIFPAADAISRQVTVELHLDEVPPGVRPGFLARANLVVERVPDAIMVPEPAVLRGAETPTFVYVVSDGKAVVRPVEVRTRIAGRALVSSGLAPGDAVVVEGMGRLRNGVAVEVGGGKAGAS